MALLEFIRENLMEFQKKILKIQTESDSLFAPTFVDHYKLPYLNFNGHCLINNIISTRKKVINLYIYCILNP